MEGSPCNHRKRPSTSHVKPQTKWRRHFETHDSRPVMMKVGVLNSKSKTFLVGRNLLNCCFSTWRWTVFLGASNGTLGVSLGVTTFQTWVFPSQFKVSPFAMDYWDVHSKMNGTTASQSVCRQNLLTTSGSRDRSQINSQLIHFNAEMYFGIRKQNCGIRAYEAWQLTAVVLLQMANECTVY